MHFVSPHEEKELLIQVADGDEKAFEQLFEFYARLLFSFLNRITKSNEEAEEVIQEVMLKIWLNRDRLADMEHPRQWMFKIARNLAFTRLKRKLHEDRIIGELRSIGPEGPDLAEEVQLEELRRHVQEAVLQMPKERRKIYQLSREAGMSREEIASHLNISPSTVKNAIVSALKSIREHLEKVGYHTLLVYLLIIKM